MFNDFRFCRRGVFARALGISSLIAILFVAGCTTNNNTPQLGVVTASAQLPAGQINVAYTQTTLTAANGTAPYTWSVTGGALPAGMILSSAGVLSGTPTASGSFNFTVQVKDSATPTPHAATAALALTVNQPPAITSANSATFTVGTAGTFTVTATGAPAPTFSETGTLPTGVTLNATTGVLSGTPAANTGGTYPITITAQNGITPNATQSFTLTVNQAPAITSGNSTSFVVATGGLFPVTASGFPAPTLSETGPLPTGVTFNTSTGVLAGTPASGTQGSYPITFTAQNGVGTNATQNFTLTVGLAPAITSATGTTFTVGSAGTFTVTATGFPASTFSETGALPSGVTLNSTTGVLSGTPAAGTGRAYPITITAQNGVGSNASQNFTLTVDQAPAITSGNSTTFTVSTPSTFTVTATGFPAPTFSETGSLPSGVTFNSTTGVLGGTPTSGSPGGYPITITAQNGVGVNATQAFTLTVGSAPTITSANNTTFRVGSAGTFTVTATGFPAPTFSETGALPSGVTLNSTTGVLSGTPGPSTGGTYPITITAQNGISPNATQNFTLTVDQSPAITSANNTTFAVGNAGTFTVTATGFPVPTFSETGALPTGVTLGTNGALTGTPAANMQGTYSITITASNGTSPNATQSFTLTVDAAPAITSVNSTAFIVGQSGTFTVTATGLPAPTFSETGALPSGVTLNSTTGVLSGTPGPNTGGTYPVTITAQNGVSPNAAQSFTLTVDQAPVITSANNTTFAVGSTNSFTVTASGFPAPTLSETGTLPSNLTFNPATGVLSGIPASGTQTSSPYSITFTAQNGIGANWNQSFTLNVSFTAPPTITSGNSTTFTVGQSGSFTVTANGAPAPTFNETGALPSGVTLNSSTGALSGTPGPNTGGTYPITITAQNGQTPNATQSFTLTVDQAPTITSANNATFTVGASGSFQMVASGFPAPTFSETGTLPPGVTLSPSGLLSGTPASGTQGSYPINITAQNGVTPNATQSFTLTVNGAPSITSSNNATFTVGTPGTFTVTATGVPAPTFSETGALPSGVTLNPTTGVLSGTPAANSGKAYSITITAQNGVLPNATQGFTLTVDQAPAITSANNATFSVGASGSFQMVASGFPAPTFSETGTLPSGVTLSPSGLLSGTPASGTQGSYPINITAQNGVSPNATQSFTLTVNTAPSFTSSNNTTFTVGTPGTFTVTASGSPAPTLGESGTLPNGVTFNASTGVLSGTPATGSGGVYSITFMASNGVSPNANQSFTLTVDEAPAITSQNSTTFTVGVAQTFNVSASGQPAATLSESGALPSGVTFTPNPSGGTAILSGTPATGSGGTYPITITAHNGIGADATQNFTLTVITDPCATIVGGNEALLTGHYAFLLKGLDNGTTGTETMPEPAIVAGVLTFNGTNNNGLITAGILDMNLNNTAGVSSHTVTGGTYKVGSDHRGCMAITTAAGTQHYRFSLGNITGGIASTGHMIDFDSAGPFTEGTLRKQDTTAFSTSKVTGNYVFEIGSAQNTAPSAGGKQAAAGVFNLSSGSVTGGKLDINDEGSLDNGLTAWPATAGFALNSGTSYTIDPSTGRGTLSMSVTINGTPTTFQNIIYVVSSSDFLILTNFDQTQLNGLFGGGDALQQATGPFSSAFLNGTSVIYLEGLQLNCGTSCPSSASNTTNTTIGTLTTAVSTSTTGSVTGTLWQNNSGPISSQPLSSITYTVDTTSGRVTLSGTGTGNHPPLFYIISASKAVALGGSQSVETGMFEPQTSTSVTSGSMFAFGDIDSQVSNRGVNSGVATFTGGTNTVAGKSDSNSNGSNNPDQAFSANYSVAAGGLGSVGAPSCTIGGTGSTGCQLIFYVISPTRAILMDLQNGSGSAQTDPSLQMADQ